MPGETPRILMVRTSAMGDIVHTLPALAKLRARWPEARIAWVVEEHFAPLLHEHAQLDAVLTVRTRAWRRMPKIAAWRDARAAIARIRAFQPTVAIDLMGNFKGGLLARLSGASLVLGARRSDRREPASAFLIGTPVAARGEHAIDRALSIVSADLTGASLVLERHVSDLGGAGILPAAQPDTDAPPYAVIQVGAGWGNKQYPIAGWGHVARNLAETGLAVKVPIAPGEEDLADSLVASSDGAAEAVDARAFEALVALLRGARVALGGDTGPIHLAHALGTPVVSVMGPTDPRRHGPYGAPESAVVHQLPCSFCYKRMSATRPCLLAISPRRIAARARRLARA